MNKQRHIIFLGLVSAVVAACESSPLGPDMSDKEAVASTDISSGVVSGNVDGTTSGGDSGGTSAVASAVSSVSSDLSGPNTISCLRTSGHDVWYYSSNIVLVYGCDEPVTEVAFVAKPSYLTATILGSTVTFAGTAPSSVSDTDWSFTANGLATIGGAATINTTILDPSSIVRSIAASPAVAGNNDGVIALEHTATLSSAWDGSTADVSWRSASISHDMQGLTLQASCATAVVSYVCDGTSFSSAKTIDSDSDLRWRYSAFDQGSYYLSLAGQMVSEGGTHTLAAETATFTIPIQTNGKVVVSHQGDVSTATLRNVQYNFDAAIGRNSSALTPQVGILYFSNDSTTVDAQFKRLVIDRTDDPSGGATGVTASTNLQVSAGAITYAGVVRSLTHSDPLYDGDWIVGGVRLDGTGQNAFVARVPNSATPATEAIQDITNFNTTANDVKYLDMTASYGEGASTRLGIAYVRSDATDDYLTVAKIDPRGTNKATFVTDARYDSDPAGNQYELSATLGLIDRVKIRYINESGGRFYVAYRNNLDLYVLKLATEWDAGTIYSSTVTSAPFTGVFSNVSGTNFQSLDLALGSVSGVTVVGVTYRDTNGDCYFKKLNQALSTAGSAVPLSTDACWWPSIHWIEKSGKFVVTWGETNTGNGNAREIYMSEITLGGTDVASTPLKIADTGTTTVDIQNLDTDYYPDGNWMTVIYRLKFTDFIHTHGFHVPGR